METHLDKEGTRRAITESAARVNEMARKIEDKSHLNSLIGLIIGLNI